MTERVIVVGLTTAAVVLVVVAFVIESVAPLFAAWAPQLAIPVILTRLDRRRQDAAATPG
jgi:hypothetical protein